MGDPEMCGPEIGEEFVHRDHVGMPGLKIAQVDGVKGGFEVAHRLGRDQCPVAVLHQGPNIRVFTAHRFVEQRDSRAPKLPFL